MRSLHAVCEKSSARFKTQKTVREHLTQATGLLPRNPRPHTATLFSPFPPVLFRGVSMVTAIQQNFTSFYSFQRTALSNAHKRKTGFITIDFQAVNIIVKENMPPHLLEIKAWESDWRCFSRTKRPRNESRESKRRNYIPDTITASLCDVTTLPSPYQRSCD